MNAAILAAGIGSRLRPLTIERPKGCVTVDGTPILAHQLEAYAEANVDCVYVVAGYRAESVREVCATVEAEHPGFDVTVRENEAFANTDNLYSLYQLQEDLDGEAFVLSNGDVVYDPEALHRLLTAPAENAIACDTSTYSDEAMKLRLDESGHVTRLSKEIDPQDAAAVGIDMYRFSADASRKLFDRIERSIEIEENYSSWTESVIDDLARRGRCTFGSVDVAGSRWVEIDDKDDLSTADRAFSTISDLSTKEAAFIDLDGTLYLDDSLISGAAEVVEALRASGTDVYFLSNNSSGWKTDYAEKLVSLGVPAGPEDVILSTDGVIDYLERNGTRKLYVVGTTAMRDAIHERGFDVSATDPEAVVVGFDTELTYDKVREATLAVRNGAEFLLAHPDLVCPTTRGMIPDCGSIGKLVETATGKVPDATFGKPNERMLTPVLEEQGLDPEDIVIVGDRLETEIQMADRIGCDSVCVLSGDTDRASIESTEFSPSLVLETVGDLVHEGFVPTDRGQQKPQRGS